MIASLRGTVTHIALTSAVIECAGVGYLVNATPRTLAELTRGEESTILTTMVVREDAMVLYGFLDEDSRSMFALLQTVSGLGPRLALAGLSVYDPAELAGAIRSQDAKRLQKIPGVGKRMAERMIVDLKDKVALYGEETEQQLQPTLPVGGVVAEEVAEALTGLGFTAAQAEKAVAKVLSTTPDATTSDALRLALRTLSAGS